MSTATVPPYDGGFNEHILLRAVEDVAPHWGLPPRLVMIAMFDTARDLRVDILELARLVVRSDLTTPPAPGSLNVFTALTLLSEDRNVAVVD